MNKNSPSDIVESLVKKAKEAQNIFEKYNQKPKQKI